MVMRTRYVTAAVALLFGIALAAAPAKLDWTALKLETSDAQARGKGGGGAGHGQGGGAGSSNWKAGGQTKGAAVGKDDAGMDLSKHSQSELDGREFGTASASAGSLNAANAATTGIDHASISSVPGLLGSYRDSLAEGDLSAAAAALASASKNPVTTDDVHSMNSLMGIMVDPATEAALANLANGVN